MSVNKFMHPRNIYKIPPDFAELAKSYPEFQDISLKDGNGKVNIDFKDPQALRILTKCLLHRDFGLNVHIPEDRLVPTLPLRLNYILWIEDILFVMNVNDQVTGIDIGTGACAIYPLLAAAKNKWRMLGTENDETSYKSATDNVTNNKLENLITLKFNETDSLLKVCFMEDANANYDFCMCNPPFYSSLQELYDSRSTARPPPKNAFTGSLPELITEGGEVEYVTKMIDESFALQNNIRVFTTMVGHKASLKDLISLLRERGVQHTHTEFCQGHTTRWGLAWTFLLDIDLQLVGPPKVNRKKNNCMAFIMQPISGVNPDVESTCTKVKEILNQLQISCKLFKKKGQKLSLEIKAHINTWSNQRRKRRQQKKEMEQIKKPKISNGEVPLEYDSTQMNQTEEKSSKVAINIKDNESIVYNKNTTFDKTDTVHFDDSGIEEVNETISKNNDKKNKDELDINKNATDQIKQKKETQHHVINVTSDLTNCKDTTQLSQHHKDGENKSESNSKEVILHAILSICKMESDIVLDMEYLSGSAGKDGMHQVVQFIKNNWK